MIRRLAHIYVVCMSFFFVLKTITWKLSLRKIKPITTDDNLHLKITLAYWIKNKHTQTHMFMVLRYILCFIIIHNHHVCHICCYKLLYGQNLKADLHATHHQLAGWHTRNHTNQIQSTRAHTHTHKIKWLTAQNTITHMCFGVKVNEMIVNQQVNTCRTMLIKLFFRFVFVWI